MSQRIIGTDPKAQREVVVYEANLSVGLSPPHYGIARKLPKNQSSSGSSYEYLADDLTWGNKGSAATKTTEKEAIWLYHRYYRTIAPLPECDECHGTGEYIGFSSRQPCSICRPDLRENKQ